MRQKNIPRRENYETRPSFRLLGAILTTFMAYLFVMEAIPLFSVKNRQVSECHQLKLSRQLMCEFGNWLTSNVPSNIQWPSPNLHSSRSDGILGLT